MSSRSERPEASHGNRIGRRDRHRVTLHVEELEPRTVPAVLSPLQVRHAYGFDQITFTANGQTIKGDGSGQTIAIVTAYDHPKIFSDVDTFDRAFAVAGNQTLYQLYGPSSKFLTKVTPQGKPGTDPTGLWALETALDVEWAHAIAPGAKILLVEARSDDFYDLLAAVDYARKQPGVSVVSMSWGAKEFSWAPTLESYFTTPAGHLGGSNGRGGPSLPGGVTFVGAAGDSGAPGLWPAFSTNVVAVGGTSLRVNQYGSYLSEVAWSKSGGGISTYFTEPAYQRSLPIAGTKRSIPDVAYNADYANGFYVYHSLPVNGANYGWWQIGGTSAGAPQWAGLVAIANQGRALAGKGALDGSRQTLPTLYQLPSSAFHDIRNGSNGYPATVGYDLVTGRGTPYAQRIVKDLVSVAYVATSATPTASPNLTTNLGKAKPQLLVWFGTTANPLASPALIVSAAAPAVSSELLRSTTLHSGFITALQPSRLNPAAPAPRPLETTKPVVLLVSTQFLQLHFPATPEPGSLVGESLRCIPDEAPESPAILPDSDAIPLPDKDALPKMVPAAPGADFAAVDERHPLEACYCDTTWMSGYPGDVRPIAVSREADASWLVALAAVLLGTRDPETPLREKAPACPTKRPKNSCS